jgi:hypothetical protein
LEGKEDNKSKLWLWEGNKRAYGYFVIKLGLGLELG